MPTTITETDRVAVEDTSLTAFYRDMSAPERRTFWPASLGYALDGLDFMIYTLVLGTSSRSGTSMRGIGRPHRHRDTSVLRDRRLGRGLPLRPRGRVRDAPDHRALVLALQSALRLRAELQPAPLVPRTARPRLRRRMDGGRGADGRDDPAALSRASRRVRAIRLGGRVGKRGAAAGRRVHACAGRERRGAGCSRWASLPAAVRAFRAAIRGGADVRRRARAREKRERRSVRIWEIFARTCSKRPSLASLARHRGARRVLRGQHLAADASCTRSGILTIVGSTSYLAFLIFGRFAGYLIGAWLADRIGRRKLFLIFSVGATRACRSPTLAHRFRTT